jgi:hypothetical protein
MIDEQYRTRLGKAKAPEPLTEIGGPLDWQERHSRFVVGVSLVVPD